MPNLFSCLRRDLDALDLWILFFLAWVPHFKVDEMVTPSHLLRTRKFQEG